MFPRLLRSRAPATFACRACRAPASLAEIEPWLFAAGRPSLLHPETRVEGALLDTAVVAWDMSRSAARAVGDALPLLTKARSVQILAGQGEKDIPHINPAASLIDYLAAHGIGAAMDVFDVSGRKIGDVILECADNHGADLLVMGAFGHWRLREFVLAGATRHLLDTSHIPLFMSH